MRIEEIELRPDSAFYLIVVESKAWYCRQRESDSGRCLFLFTDEITAVNFSSQCLSGKEWTAVPIPLKDFTEMLGEMRNNLRWVAIDATDKDKFSAIVIDDFLSILNRYLSQSGEK
jgi:hypothetical protein